MTLLSGRADGSTKHLHSLSVTQLAGLDAVAARQAFVQDSCCVCERLGRLFRQI
jgi:hypothetical protein